MSDNNNDDSRRYEIEDFIKNFPFPTIRPKQLGILMQITDALNAGYRIIILESPTGFGKSAVAISMAKTLGSSYICSKTKVLQDQCV